jgi:hypothetical protein
MAAEYFQPAVQVNYPNDFDFTRIVETKHITGQKFPVTTIVREYPEDFGPGKEPYYPIPTRETESLHRKYAELAARQEKVSFVGTLSSSCLPVQLSAIRSVGLKHFYNAQVGSCRTPRHCPVISLKTHYVAPNGNNV